jgi:hypothetical protein
VGGCGQLVCAADQISMAWFNREAPMAKSTLTTDERTALARLEQTVEAGVDVTLAVHEAGKALAEIRNRQLFRDSSASWEDYVSKRFQITKRRADQIIAFAGVHDALQELGTQVPSLSEKAARPLVGLSPDLMAEAVIEAASSPEGVTAGSIRKAASRRRKAKASKVPRPRRFKVPGAVVTVTFNRKGNGSAIDALAAAHRQAEADLEAQADAA